MLPSEAQAAHQRQASSPEELACALLPKLPLHPWHLALWRKPHTDVTTFQPFNFKAAMVYHRIYHCSLGLHLNHLFFLNTYLFGVWLLLASVAPRHTLLAVASLFSAYAALLTRGRALPYVVLALALAKGASSLSGYLQGLGLVPGQVAAVAVATILGSFMCQLTGHWTHEYLNAPPSLMHGFVSAPVLEFVSLLWRLGLDGEECESVMRVVDAERAKAFAQHFSSLVSADD